MYYLPPLEPIDYLVIGHVTQDLTPNGPLLGGTAAYSALTAKALGLRVGIVTACTDDLAIARAGWHPDGAYYSDENTTFENIITPTGRIQYLHHRAHMLTPVAGARNLAAHADRPSGPDRPGSGSPTWRALSPIRWCA